MFRLKVPVIDTGCDGKKRGTRVVRGFLGARMPVLRIAILPSVDVIVAGSLAVEGGRSVTGACNAAFHDHI